MNPLVCIYEDRPSYAVAVQLLILSLRKFHPELTIRLRFPSAQEKISLWCATIPRLTLVTESLEGAGSYNIKPHMLLDGLNTGAAACLWLDTDIILNKYLPWLSNLDTDTFISTLDPYQYENGSTYRAEAFGLEAQAVGMPGAINSAVVLVHQHHKDLLLDWGRLLKLPEYQLAQAQPVKTRNPMMLGDQDALSALVASEKYAHLKIRLLTHPNDILHHQGVGALSFRDRVRFKYTENLPALIHSMASIKPWVRKNNTISGNFLKNYYYQIFLETSPYVCKAKEYQHLLTEDASWLQEETIYAKIMLRLFGNNPVAAGALQSLVHLVLASK